MAQCKLTPHEFIQNAFAPQVAVLCSEDADNLCLKNNLRFVELIQPFCRLNSECRISDHMGNSIVVRNLKVEFEDMNKRPPQPTLGKKLLSEVVNSTPWDRQASKTIAASGTRDALALELQHTTPWYESWRDTFLHIQYPSDHEFTKHYIACIIVVSSGSENPLDQLNRLSQYQHQQQHQTPARYPKWFCPNLLKYYLLVHDTTTGDLEAAETVYEQMSSMYGAANCHLLQINSRPHGQMDIHLPDPWSQFLQFRSTCESGGTSSETSSGTGTPREDVSGMPTRVMEGDSLESVHPLSPMLPPPTEDGKNGIIDGIGTNDVAPDIPVILNNQSLPVSSQAVHHGGCLTSSDVDRIRIFVHEFCLRSLLPYVERQIKYLNEAVTNRSRSKSLFSATRRWLGGNKAPGTANNTVVYSPEATELQTRRLGDLCFMFGLYELAYNAYHTAKNDFKSDQAWLYFAGAQEMAGLAAFMHSSADYPKRYLEGSLQTYLSVCKVYNYAIRLTLLSTEVLKHMGEYSDAALTFIKMTSEESDLLSALMLEQAAHCFINARRPLPRKYAFHMTLAGHRYSKAGQRAHSLRAYKQAFQVYASRGWVLAEDHIYFTMGKQAHHLKQLEEGLSAYTKLVDQRAKQDAPSQQSVVQQQAYIREYIYAFQQYLQQEWDASTGLPYLPLPIIRQEKTQVLIGDIGTKSTNDDLVQASNVSFDDGTGEASDNTLWFALERKLVRAAQGVSPIVFRPQLQLLTDKTPNLTSPVVPVGESVWCQLIAENPLSVGITVSDVRLQYTFSSSGGGEEESSVVCEPHAGCAIEPHATEKLQLQLVPMAEGKVQITGLVYKLHVTPDATTKNTETPASAPVAIEGQQSIEVQGPRLNNTSAEKCGVVYAQDQRLCITVVPKMPKLNVKFDNIPQVLKCGQLHAVGVEITNSGPIALNKLLLGVNDPNHVYFENKTIKLSSDYVVELKGETAADAEVKSNVSVIQNCVMEPGHSIRGVLWLHAPVMPGAFNVKLLFYCEVDSSVKRYKLLRHHLSVYVERSISLKVSAQHSQCMAMAREENNSGSMKDPHGCNLVLRIQNKTECESDDPVSIVGVSTNSSHWTITSFAPIQDQVLDIGKSTHICVQCKRPNMKSESKLVLSQVPFSGSLLQNGSWWRFSLRERIKLPDLLYDPPSPKPSSDHIPPPPTQDQLDAKNITNTKVLDMVVTVHWQKTKDQQVFGQHSVYLKSIGDSSTVPEPLSTDALVEEKAPVRIIPEKPLEIVESPISALEEQCHLVKVWAIFPSIIIHDFTCKRLCTIDLVLQLKNCSGCELMTMLDLNGAVANESGSSQLLCPQASRSVLWVGGALRRVELAPHDTQAVKVKVLVMQPGTYNLGAFQLQAHRKHAWANEALAVQACQLPVAVAVQQLDIHRQTLPL
ncbi:trafficking protein particle complex subunit 8 homolog l(3)76BDm [Oratosquilla oratoria]|uniref:trafficking protein particle complex subunit 8 homolog l(3)76BDm n=1 Tax=Oratosquilla oratoria TaxID=337810 RepID=UPI003F760A17